MKTFLDWIKVNNLEDTLVVGTPAQETDTPEGEEATGENTKRTGYSFNYPDAYVRAHYPHKYFNPIKATADLDLEAKPPLKTKGNPPN